MKLGEFKNAEGNFQNTRDVEGSQVVHDVKRIRSELLDALFEGGDLDDMDRYTHAVEDYVDRMKEKYPDSYDETRSFHLLMGSGFPKGKNLVDDFPRDDSVLKFLHDLKKNLLRSESV